jgi:hypothetical protein
VRQRFTAGLAPGGPEIDQNDLPLQPVQGNVLPIRGCALKWRRDSQSLWGHGAGYGAGI